MTTETPVPRTEAGRSFLVKADGTPSAFLNGLRLNVLAIEAEAARIALEGVAERVRAKVEKVLHDRDMSEPPADLVRSVVREALALLSFTPAEEDGT